MPAYHYHPDNIIYIRHLSGDYMAEIAEFEADYGGIGVYPSEPYCEIYYDLDDVKQRENRCNITPLNDAIKSDNPEIEAIINDYVNLMAAKFARENPPLTFEQKKQFKISELKSEGLSRIQIELPAVSNFDELELIREQWLSMSPAARNPTTKFQQVIDIYTAGRNAASEINALILENEIDAYNVITDPAWPI